MMPHVGLFIPCYMDAFEPEVGIATLQRFPFILDHPVIRYEREAP
jgi:hypothetical protein